MPTLFCDVNETTLDLAPIAAAVDDALGRGAAPLWFARLVHHSTVLTLTGVYAPFTELAAAAFASTAHTVEGDAGLWPTIAPLFADLPAHPDVVPGLTRFREAGWGVVALTNSPRESLERGLRAAGVIDRFDRLLTVEATGRFKPDPAPYRRAMEEVGVGPDGAWMVASHDWDLAGAAAVGMHTAFVARPRMPFSSAYPTPMVTVSDYEELADRLL